MALLSRPRPVATPVATPKSPESYFASISRQPFPFLLDWTDPTRPDRAWTLMGSNPIRVLISKGERVTEWRAGRARTRTGDPFAAIEKALKEHAMAPADAGEIPFAGGSVGYFGYDLGGRLERLPRESRDDRGLPDLVLAFHDR
ncbi:MAG TPA: hypothetical protein VK661_12305, partial [Planctomycetota bacterium]|nr:hypothetical protein [Planctomycetota bacterium]